MMPGQSSLETQMGMFSLYSFASPEQIRNLSLDPQLAEHSGFGSLNTRRQILMTRSAEENSNVVLAVTGEEKIVGVNTYLADDVFQSRSTERPDADRMNEHVMRFKAYKEQRSQDAVQRALDSLKHAANDTRENVYERIVEAAEAGVTHGEIVSLLRRELGFGHPLVIV